MSGKMTDMERILLEKIDQADAIVIGGGSGMSSAAGYDHYHWSSALSDSLAAFREYYNFRSPLDGFYYCFSSYEERWAYMARSGFVMLDLPAGQTYRDLYTLVGDKDHYIITTNQDAQFAKVFDPDRIFTIQGDAHWMQCAARCHDKIYPSEEILHFSIWKLLGRTSCEI